MTFESTTSDGAPGPSASASSGASPPSLQGGSPGLQVKLAEDDEKEDPVSLAARIRQAERHLASPRAIARALRGELHSPLRNKEHAPPSLVEFSSKSSHNSSGVQMYSTQI